MNNNIPTFLAQIIDSDDGIQKISLVDMPAVESNFLYFKEQSKKPVKFEIEKEEERVVIGVIMRADFPIYRYDEEFGEYYIKYTKDCIKTMAQKLLFDGNQNKVNLMHMDGTDVDGVLMQELFIKDTEKGIVPVGFDDIEDGSLFGKFKIMNDEIWAAIKEGAFKGFSLEGLFNVTAEREKLRKFKSNKNKDNLMNKFKEALKKLIAEFGEVKTVDGKILEYQGDELVVGGIIEAEDGQYILDNGKTITVKDGQITDISEPAVEDEKPVDEKPVEEETKAEEEEKPADEEKAEEKPAEDEKPAEEEKPSEDETKAEIEALKGEIEALKGELEALKEMLQKPAAKPISEEFEKTVETKKTGDSKYDKMIEKYSHLKEN